MTAFARATTVIESWRHRAVANITDKSAWILRPHIKPDPPSGSLVY